MIPFLKECLFGSRACTAVALEPLTEQQSMAHKSYIGSPTRASDSVDMLPAVAPAVWPQRSAPVVAQQLTVEQAALMVMLGMPVCKATPLLA